MASNKHDKTEAPTPKRKKEARREGQVAKSPEVSAWISVLVATSVLPPVIASTASRVAKLQAMTSSVIANPDEHAAVQLLGRGLSTVLGAVMPLAAAMVAVGVVTNLAQTRGALATKKLKPSWKRLNPKSGIKRLLSPASYWEGGKSLLKVGILALVGWRSLATIVPHLIGTSGLQLGTVVGSTTKQALSFIRLAAGLGLVLAMTDYLLQHKRIRSQLRMSKQEIKEEGRMTDGSPEMKRAIKSRQFKMSRLRMMAEVARADAIIVNPTHFAVAVTYEQTRGAPRVVAKGTDDLALRIREEAVAHGVPIVEDPPLARTIYAACNLGDEIPAELYEAVARVLAFLFRLRARGRLTPLGGGPLRVPGPGLLAS